ncbi:hypothetical protein FACS1894151_04110 [Spirochaetia bacterium]|nr:hypothetical protein FACS1894151_04110 [Spirochaetia bacterium]
MVIPRSQEELTATAKWTSLSSVYLCWYFFIIRSEAKIDSLTGISNRYAFNEFIEKLSRQTTKESWYFVMIDMDHFKKINDKLGHLEGDNALRDMASVLKGCIRHTDFVARYGGDEFIIATPTTYKIQTVMDRIQEMLANQNSKNLRPYKLEISYGYDIFTANSEQSIQTFLNHIDSLMYKDKAARRRSTDR